MMLFNKKKNEILIPSVFILKSRKYKLRGMTLFNIFKHKNTFLIIYVLINLILENSLPAKNRTYATAITNSVHSTKR